MPEPKPKRAEHNAGAFLNPSGIGGAYPVTMSTLSDEYHDEPEPEDSRSRARTRSTRPCPSCCRMAEGPLEVLTEVRNRRQVHEPPRTHRPTGAVARRTPVTYDVRLMRREPVTMFGPDARRVIALATVLVFAAAGCTTGRGAGSGSPVGTIGGSPTSSTPLGSPDLAAVRADIESRYMDQLLLIGDGAGTVILTLKPTATAAAADILSRYGSAVQITVGFFPYPSPSQASGGCPIAPSRTVDPGPLRAVIELPTSRISHTVGFPAKVTLTNTGSATLKMDTGQPLSIYLFTSDGTALVGASPGAIGGTGLRLELLPGASHEIDAGGGTASCDLRLGYELPDGPYVARAAVEIDGTSPPGYFWSDPVSIQLTTP